MPARFLLAGSEPLAGADAVAQTNPLADAAEQAIEPGWGRPSSSVCDWIGWSGGVMHRVKAPSFGQPTGDEGVQRPLELAAHLAVDDPP